MLLYSSACICSGTLSSSLLNNCWWAPQLCPTYSSSMRYAKLWKAELAVGQNQESRNPNLRGRPVCFCR